MNEMMTYKNAMDSKALAAILNLDAAALGLLLDQGMSPDATWVNHGSDGFLSDMYVDGIWMPALHLARDHSDDECFELLLARGANPYALDSMGLGLASGTPRHRFETVSILARFGMDFNLPLDGSARAESSFVEFMGSAHLGDDCLIELMIRLGADPNAMFRWRHAEDGDPELTPLCIGLLLNQWEHCERLLDFGADPLLQLPDGRVPLSFVRLDDTAENSALSEPSAPLRARLKSIKERLELSHGLALAGSAPRRHL